MLRRGIEVPHVLIIAALLVIGLEFGANNRMPSRSAEADPALIHL